MMLRDPYPVELSRVAAWVALSGCLRAIEALERGGARCENGRFVETLRHHRHARGQNRDFLPGRQA